MDIMRFISKKYSCKNSKISSVSMGFNLQDMYQFIYKIFIMCNLFQSFKQLQLMYLFRWLLQYWDLNVLAMQPILQDLLNDFNQTYIMQINRNFRLLSLNQCICQNDFMIMVHLICEIKIVINYLECSNQCLTCQGRRDNCTSCDSNRLINLLLINVLVNQVSIKMKMKIVQNTILNVKHVFNLKIIAQVVLIPILPIDKPSLKFVCAKLHTLMMTIKWIAKNAAHVANCVQTLQTIVQLVLAIQEIYLLFEIANLDFLKILLKIVKFEQINV